ncbi:hypothetical protein BDV36DRAFT_268513 [Aspergillus pseudocaelatus]|uniref:Uncharacterized protein n=1 Tax=Aspergillus pseudocaelatus TaxID=1825620 RepID=A0ABQ6W8H1_9EURO|nr:hypothetical protein BDV36DRAFT_268513 [Aspergillus pseudocaelatus]
MPYSLNLLGFDIRSYDLRQNSNVGSRRELCAGWVVLFLSLFLYASSSFVDLSPWRLRRLWSVGLM